MPTDNVVVVWIAIDKETLKPVAVESFMEDLPFEGNWLVNVDIDLSEKVEDSDA